MATHQTSSVLIVTLLLLQDIPAQDVIPCPWTQCVCREDTRSPNKRSIYPEIYCENLQQVPPFDVITGQHYGRLYFGSSTIQKIQSRAFDGLWVDEIYLESLNIEVIESDSFDGLQNLTILRLGFNQITTLPAGLLASSPQLKELYLNSNQITTLPAGLLASTPLLNRLWLNSNHISYTPPCFLQYMTNDSVCHLYDNNLTAITMTVFHGRELHLANNKIEAIPSGLYMPNLQRLGLYDNSISHIADGALQSMTSLRHLYLYSNKITSLPMNFLEKNTEIQHVHLRDNPIMSVEVCFILVKCMPQSRQTVQGVEITGDADNCNCSLSTSSEDVAQSCTTDKDTTHRSISSVLTTTQMTSSKTTKDTTLTSSISTVDTKDTTLTPSISTVDTKDTTTTENAENEGGSSSSSVAWTLAGVASIICVIAIVTVIIIYTKLRKKRTAARNPPSETTQANPNNVEILPMGGGHHGDPTTAQVDPDSLHPVGYRDSPNPPSVTTQAGPSYLEIQPMDTGHPTTAQVDPDYLHPVNYKASPFLLIARNIQLTTTGDESVYNEIEPVDNRYAHLRGPVDMSTTTYAELN